ncbi:MAG: excisionase [Faecousia sp.]
MQEFDALEARNDRTQQEVPIWQKYALTLPEACVYFHIGENKLRKFINEHRDARFVLWVGSRLLIKRTEFERFLDSQNTV